MKNRNGIKREDKVSWKISTSNILISLSLLQVFKFTQPCKLVIWIKKFWIFTLNVVLMDEFQFIFRPMWFDQHWKHMLYEFSFASSVKLVSKMYFKKYFLSSNWKKMFIRFTFLRSFLCKCICSLVMLTTRSLCF